jgi:2-dehydropantoate 2-reductase
MEKRFRVAIVGMGALGALYARDITSHKSNIDLYGVVRDITTHWGSPIVVNSKPLKINCRTVETLKSIPFDLILLCVKSYELADAVGQIEDLVGKDTLIGSVTCGIEAGNYLCSIFGPEKVFIAVPEKTDVSRILYHVTIGRKGCLLLGCKDGDSKKNELLEVIFNECHIAHKIVTNIDYCLWKQFMFDLAIGQTTLVYQLTYGEYVHNEKAMEMAFNAMVEIVNLAKNLGISLAFSDIANCIDNVKALSNKGRSCMLQDYWVDRRLETDALCDKAVALASRRKVGFQTNLLLRDQIQKMVIKGSIKATENTNADRLSTRVGFVPTSEYIAQQLRVDILKGKYTAGANLKETEIAHRFDASRCSVRSALQTVSDEGLLKTLSNGRREVVEITEKQLIDLFTVRLLLETKAVETIVADATIDISNVKSVLDEIDLKYKHNKGKKDWNELDIKFHGEIVDSARNIFLSNSFRTIAPLWFTVTNFNNPLRQDPNYAAQFFTSHSLLLGLLEQRGKEVYTNLKAHIEKERDEMLLINGYRAGNGQ